MTIINLWVTIYEYIWCKDKTKELVNKSDISNPVEDSDLITLATKAELKGE